MKKVGIVFLLGFLFVQIPYAQKTPVENLYEYRLSNGLTLFVAENHAVPLTYIEIAVRCGAYTQEKENTGLFHLYEHMMFKGNSLFKNAAEVTNALTRLGVSGWNGTTDLECVNYYFTVPSSVTKKGLEFWSAAIRSPLLDKNELENEKKVVISEINGNFSSPSRILTNFESRTIFSDSPWKMDPSGSVPVVKNATVQNLLDIQKAFYIPNNSALFVGGDVEHEKVYKMVDEIFGGWKKGENPFKNGFPSHSKNPFSKTYFCVMPFDSISEEIARISVKYRGPDAAFEREDTYAMDIFTECLSNPSGKFKKSILADEYIESPSAEYVSQGYLTRRTCGTFGVNVVVTNPEKELSERAKYFSSRLPELLKNAAESITEEDIARTVVKLQDSNIYTNETAQGILRNVRFWWTVADEDYAFTYDKKMSEIKAAEIRNVVEKYIKGKNPLVTVLVNPKVYEKTKKSFMEAGFTEIKSDNAFWFK